MKNKVLVAGAMMMLAGYFATAQNNPIFFGGSGDGSSAGSYLQYTNDVLINFGGQGDGHTFASYAQVIVATTAGGSGDGYHAVSGGIPAVDQLFTGGAADGIASASSGSPLVDKIFFGGEADGHAWATSQTPNVDKIFYGGIGDGWASNFLPITPLPLSLLSFTGIQVKGQHFLNWETVQEINTEHFELQRSASGSGFVTLGEVKAAGHSQQKEQYEYIDSQPLNGNNFYRLKMVDADTKFTYSNVVLLRLLKDKSVLQIYPNPTASVLNIELSGKQDNSEILIDVYDASARLVARKTMKKDNNVLQLDVSKLAAGMYSIRIVDQEDMSVVKFVKN